MSLLIQGHHIVTTTCEVDALAQATNKERADEDDSGNAPDSERLLVHTHEVVLGVLHQVLRVTSYEGQVHPLVLLQTVLVNQTGQEHSGEE